MALGNNPTQLEVVKAIKDLENAPAQSTDVQVNGTSITSGGVANIVTESAYNASTNKIATKNDITKANAGLSNVANERQYSANNPPPYPVTSVNGQKGAVTGLATSNPNLLINSNFAINQRDGYFAPVGATVYADDLTTVLGTVRTAIQTNIYNATWRVATSIAATLNGSNITISTGYIKKSDCTMGSYARNALYAIDRWMSNYGILEVLTNGIKHTSTGTWQGIRQIIENPSKLAGKTLTISAKGRASSGGAFRIYLYSQKSGQSRVTVASSWTDSTTDTIISASGTIPSDITDSDMIYVMLYNSFANVSFWCEWVKLEIGDVATEYTPPLIAEELLKCQRYYQIVRTKGGSANIFGFGALRSAKNARIEIPTVSTLRVAPTVSTHNIALLNLQTGGIVQSGITITTLSITNNNIFLQNATTSDIGTTGANVQLYGLSAESYIAFDAEFY